MKFNYPIKYAVMPIFEQVGWTHEFEKVFDVACYIVSKCYLISEKTKYKENGTSEKEYEIVFPYQKKKYHCFERVFPLFDFNNSCINSKIVENIFDNYDEALESATKKNQKICKKALLYLSCDEKKYFDELLSKYEEIQRKIIEGTSDMEISKVKELKDVIIGTENKIIPANLYQYLNCCSCLNVAVYSVSLEEYEQLITSIEKNEEIDFSSLKSTLILYHDKKLKNYFFVIDESGKVLYYIDEWGNLNENSNERQIEIIGDEMKLFVTETLEDILLSFDENKPIKEYTLTKKRL